MTCESFVKVSRRAPSFEVIRRNRISFNVVLGTDQDIIRPRSPMNDAATVDIFQRFRRSRPQSARRVPEAVSPFVQ